MQRIAGNVLDLLQLARQYLMPHLGRHCMDYVRQNISAATAIPFFVWADERAFDDVRSAALGVLAGQSRQTTRNLACWDTFGGRT